MAAVLIILVLDRPLSHVYWLNVADRSIPFVAVVEQTNFIGPEHYGGKHMRVPVQLPEAPATRSISWTTQELLQEYLPHLRKVNPAFDLSWIETSYHHRIDGAQPIITTGYSDRIPDHRTPFKGVYLANTTQVYPEDRGTNYSVRMEPSRRPHGDGGFSGPRGRHNAIACRIVPFFSDDTYDPAFPLARSSTARSQRLITLTGSVKEEELWPIFSNN